MTDMRVHVLELAAIDDGPPVISLYLDTAWRDEQQRERVRLFWRDRSRDARRFFGEETEDTKAIADTLDEITPWVDDVVNQAIHPEARGMVLFASVPRNLFLEYQLSARIESAMFLDTRPRLFPLVQTLARDLPALLVSIDSQGAEIVEWRTGETIPRGDIERAVPRRHKRGGWSQRKFGQHIRHLIKDVWKQSAALLDRVVLETRPINVILFGQEANIRGFERLLSSAARSRVIGMRPAPFDQQALLEEARQILDDERVAREFAVVHHILRQGLSDRSGTVGLQDTLMASNERRIRSLALSHRFDVSGYRCRNCDALWTSGATGCVFCGGRTEPAPLREVLTRRCVAEHGDVIVVPDGGPLDAYQGIGSLLRHLTGREHQHDEAEMLPAV